LITVWINHCQDQIMTGWIILDGSMPGFNSAWTDHHLDGYPR
jgi:hypothetical protein